MKSHGLFLNLLILLIPGFSDSQTDSLGKESLASIQVDVGFIPFYNSNLLSAEKYATFVKDDPSLAQDFSNFTKGGGYSYSGFGPNVFLSVRYFKDITGDKKRRRDLHLGLRTGKAILNST